MKGNVKKIFAAVLALALVISVAGCGKNDGLSKDGTYEVVWYNGEQPQNDHQEVYAKLSEITKEKINVTVNYTPIAPAEYAEKMRLKFAAGEKIDLCFASTGTNYEVNARDKAYMDMGPLLDGVGKKTKDLFPQYALDCWKVGGVQFGIPVLKDWAFQPFLNPTTQMLKDAGVYDKAVNSTELSEWTDIIAAVSANEKANYGGSFYGILMRGNHTLFKFVDVESIPGSVVAGFTFDNYDKVVNVYNTDEAKEFYALMRTWYQAGYIKNDAATSTSDADIWKVGNYLSGHGEWLPGTDGENPTSTSILGLTTPRMSTSQVTATGIAMGRTCLQPEMTMELVNLIYNDAEIRNLTGLGIEGKHWIDDGANFKLPEGVETKADTGFESATSRMGNRWLLKADPGYPADTWDQWQAFNENATISPAIGFTFDPEPVAGQIAAVQNVYNEFMPSILVGAVDPKVELPKAIAKMNSVGAEDIIKEVQKQYDEWKKNK